MIIDMHNHCLPPTALEHILDAPEWYGVGIEETEKGPVFMLIGDIQPGHRFSLPFWRWVTDLTERKARLQQLGVEGMVLSILPGFHRYTLPVELEKRLCQTLNDGLAEWIAEEATCRGMATVPLQDGRAAATELYRATEELGLRGALILTHIGKKNLDLPDLAPFWEAAEALQAPIFIHPNPFDLATKERLDSYGLGGLLGVPFDITVAAASLVVSGVLDRYPRLKVVLSHGGGYLPIAFGRLNYGYDKREETCIKAIQPPESYLRRFYYDTILFHPEPLYNLIRLVGAERVLLGTDYPFPSPLSAQAIESLHLAVKESQAILGGAAELYGFEVGEDRVAGPTLDLQGTEETPRLVPVHV